MALVSRQRSQLGVTELAKQHTKDAACWFRDYLTAIKHGRWHPFTNLERKVREATRNDPWGPTGTMLNELAELSMNRADCDIINAVLVFRLGYPPIKWRNVYKALTVLEFLIKRGSNQCVQAAQQEIAPRLAQLQNFSYVAPDGRDQGLNVAHRAAAIQALLGDETRLQQERDMYRQRRNTYQGFAREDVPATAGQPFAGNVEGSTRETTEAPTSEFGAVSRSAGEMKGVSMEENRRRLAALKGILDRAENRVCADCQASGGSVRPSWASINTGVFICMSCAGIHRGLGVHISKVRSCTLDTWLQSQVDFMDQTGNAIANSYWECKIGAVQRPSSGPHLEAFIRRKYNGEWAEGTWPPAVALSIPAPDTGAAGSHEQGVEAVAEPTAAEVALPPQEDLLRWDSDNKIEAEPMSDGNLASQPNTQAQQSLSAPYMQSQQGYQQHSTGGWSAPGGVPVGYPTPGAAPNFQARPNSAVRMQSQAWGNSNTAGLKALQLAPDQSAALQEYVGFSLMDDHMDMAAVNSALPPAMDISPLTPRPPPTSTAATPTPHNALVLYQSPPAQPLTSSASNGWYQPGILPSMQRFDGPQHQLSFEHSTDFSQPGNAGMSNGGMQARAAFGGEQQTQGGANPLQSAGISSTRPFSAGFRPGPRQQHQQQQQQPFTPPEEAQDPLEALVRRAMSDYNLPQPKTAAWIPEGPKEDQSLMAVKQRQFEAQNGLAPRTQVALHSDATGMHLGPPAPSFAPVPSF